MKVPLGQCEEENVLYSDSQVEARREEFKRPAERIVRLSREDGGKKKKLISVASCHKHCYPLQVGNQCTQFPFRSMSMICFLNRFQAMLCVDRSQDRSDQH